MHAEAEGGEHGLVCDRERERAQERESARERKRE